MQPPGGAFQIEPVSEPSVTLIPAPTGRIAGGVALGVADTLGDTLQLALPVREPVTVELAAIDFDTDRLAPKLLEMDVDGDTDGETEGDGMHARRMIEPAPPADADAPPPTEAVEPSTATLGHDVLMKLAPPPPPLP